MSEQKSNINWSLSRQDSAILKGIAILGMLCWHIFYCPNPEVVVFSSFTRTIGIWGNVCVSAFLFASGYGLAIQYAKPKQDEWGGASFRFVIRRMMRFYSGYWMVLLIFLPIGIFAFDAPLCENDGVITTVKEWVREILALRGHDSYNMSWWFNALIIALYLLFPLLYHGVKNSCILTLLVAYLVRHLELAHISIGINRYLFIFVVGIALAAHADKVSELLNRLPRWGTWLLTAALLLIPMVVLPLTDHGAIFYSGLSWYAMLTIGLCLLIIMLIRNVNWLGSTLAYLGKHSANIYLVQSLLYYYWFHKFFYSLGNPYLIVLVLTLTCLGTSIVLEAIKKYSGYDRLFNKVIEKI